MNHLALLSESAPNSKATKYQQVTLEAELAGAAAREGGGARGGGEARAAEERHGVRRGRHHAGAPASSGQLPLSLRRLAEAASRPLLFFPSRSLGLSLLWRAMRPKWSGYCARMPGPRPAVLSRCGEGTRGRMLGSDWPGPYLQNPCGWPLVPGTDFDFLRTGGSRAGPHLARCLYLAFVNFGHLF